MSIFEQRCVLKPEDHEFFIENGYVVVKHAVPKDVIEVAVRTLEKASYKGNPGAGDYIPVRNEAIDACVTQTVLDAAGEIFGEAYPFNRSVKAADMPRPYQPGGEWKSQGFHIDDDYPTAMPNGDALSAFIFLTPVRKHGGAFIYYEKSPNNCRRVMMDNPDWLHFVRLDEDLAGQGQEYLAEPGDVLFFHHAMVHEGSSNVSDPQTRHALLIRWHPYRRIVPGSKPFEEMTTIEKTNSARYLRHKYGTRFRLPELAADERSNRLLAGGFRAAGSIRAHLSLRCGGLNHLFYVDDTAPGVIRHAESGNWTDWQAEGTLEVGGSISTLHYLRSGKTTQLFVGVESEHSESRIYTSEDLENWTCAAILPENWGASGLYTSDFGSKRTWGFSLLYTSGLEAADLEARWGDRQYGGDFGADRVSEWRNHALIAGMPEGAGIADAFVKHTGDSNFALIMDTYSNSEPGASQILYALSSDGLSFEKPAKPLVNRMPEVTRQIRVFARGRYFWLVSYLRKAGDGERLFWGTIDWEEPVAVLREIDSVQGLTEALYLTGLL